MTERPVSEPGVRMEFHDLADGALPRFTAEPGAVDVPTENGFEDPSRGGEGVVKVLGSCAPQTVDPPAPCAPQAVDPPMPCVPQAVDPPTGVLHPSCGKVAAVGFTEPCTLRPPYAAAGKSPAP